jgi:hypothetical protein
MTTPRAGGQAGEREDSLRSGEALNTPTASPASPSPVGPQLDHEVSNDGSDFWENEARRYAGNADYWRGRFKRAIEQAVQVCRERSGKSAANADSTFYPEGFVRAHEAESCATAIQALLEGK